MTAMDDSKNFPTMIIPAGTEIAVNEQGQLSIRTPGNLVIQNSGVYSVIESGSGSVRIDPEVRVEAVSVQAADSCFVAGELTAWRVKATKITLEKGAQANIMLQESETLELDRNARLVGNFASEKELYLTLGRFSRQLRSLPQNFGPGDAPEPRIAPFGGSTAGEAGGARLQDPSISPDGEDEPSTEELVERDEILSLVRVLLERELGRPALKDSGRLALERLLELVRGEDLPALKDVYRYLLSQVEKPSEDLERAGELIAKLYAS
jgi:hypothetical protein